MARTIRETPRKPTRRRVPDPPRNPAVAVHAHRGGSALAPENTMAAFRGAMALGVDHLEFDVRRCGSGELVVVHDADLSRLAGQPQRVDSLPLGELQQVDVGSHFDPAFAGERVPTLVEVLEELRDRVRFNIEVKEDGLGGDGTATAVGRLVAAMGLDGGVIVSSFNPGSLWRVRRCCGAPLGLIHPMEGDGSRAQRLRDRVMRRPWAAPLLGVYALHPREDLVAQDDVLRAHRSGLAVNTWTVNDEERMRELVAMRVNAIITDRPDLALRVTAETDPVRRPAG
jgi:glycerophosphoryl diester phosphodiesterase